MRYHDGQRYSALVKFGRTRMHAVIIDEIGVRVVSEPLTSSRHCQPLTLGGKTYPIARMAKHLPRAYVNNINQYPRAGSLFVRATASSYHMLLSCHAGALGR
jgi:hypothetical protein